MLYVAGVLIAFDQVAEVLATARPYQPDLVQWRFGVYGLLAVRTSPLAIGDAFLLVAAAGLGHWRVLRGLGALHYFTALLLAAGLVGFALDAIQLRTSIRPEVSGTVLAATVRAAVVGLLALVYCIAVGVFARRAGRVRGRPRERSADLLVVSPSEP